MSVEIEQIKERINVADLLGEYLRLEKAGTNYKALCPFHQEKTPSFMVNPERNFWYCFGCQKGGDIFSFLQEIEGIDFREALERLADKAGVELPKFSRQATQVKTQKQKALEILEAATDYYQKQLEKNKAGEGIKKYLKQRGIDDRLIGKFRIGYAPDGWRNGLDYLTGRGWTKEDILSTGLLVQSGDKIYDRFRDRIIFPILEVTGKVVGYSARVAPGGDESTAKYINTPQTIVYDKSRVLYGLYQSRGAIRKADYVIVVEGNTDVIVSHGTGVRNVVAVSGTALTEEHIRLIKRYTTNAKLCFDMDEAGQKATARSIRSCLRGELETKIIILPKGNKDVGELAVKNPKAWKEAVADSMPVMEYFFAVAEKKYDQEKITEKKQLARELLNVIKDIADPIEQNYWIKKLAAKISVEEDILTAVLEKVKLKKTPIGQTQEKTQKSEKKNKSKEEILQARLLGLFALFPDELWRRAKEMEKGDFSPPFDDYLEALKKGQTDQFATEINQLITQIKYSYDSKQGFIENQIEPSREWQVTQAELKLERDRKKREKLLADLKKAEEAGDEKTAEMLLEELKKIT